MFARVASHVFASASQQGDFTPPVLGSIHKQIEHSYSQVLSLYKSRCMTEVTCSGVKRLTALWPHYVVAARC